MIDIFMKGTGWVSEYHATYFALALFISQTAVYGSVVVSICLRVREVDCI